MGRNLPARHAYEAIVSVLVTTRGVWNNFLHTHTDRWNLQIVPSSTSTRKVDQYRNANTAEVCARLALSM
ncbi:hypothetical protein LTR72_004832 [Exophiala xenobiotica]|nr:hypothetical protein LTR92_001005 [Exophiala xenobiotica]KAK5223446.1 hypothetical protein LTR72_004832 [Exophiala xenobiotica]KAK5286468.1 hypothetical protein LTR14_010136 [Exophiala xenobiotica]KAK5418327.1 hypothetical protein LTR06_002077 [Exophiala xenobiotica]KAK5472224.1 hypothetical protein LTR55_010518 [Exophiala xenobiotica]